MCQVLLLNAKAVKRSNTASTTINHRDWIYFYSYPTNTLLVHRNFDFDYPYPKKLESSSH